MCLESSLGTDNRVHVVLFNTYFKIEEIVSWERGEMKEAQDHHRRKVSTIF